MLAQEIKPQEVDEKDQLLQEVSSLLEEDKSFNIRYLLSLFIIMTLFLLVLFPKIYFQNGIYYKSRDIAVLKREYHTLKEENRLIKMKVEKMRFKNQVIDTMFNE